MAIKYVVAHRKDYNNVGDIASNPLQYFLAEDEYQSVDINEIGISVFNEDLPLIIGGGGLIGNNTFGDIFDRFCKAADKFQLEELYLNGWKLHNNKNRNLHEKFSEDFQNLIRKTISKLNVTDKPKFVWGAGHNESGEYNKEDLTWPESLANFDLIGIRDYNCPSMYQWAPCASCMHPALRENYTIKNDIIWFEHKKQLIRDFGTVSIPRFINSGSNIEQTIELLGSANIILTNSYHGAYWGTLLKKRVIVVGPWSTKFHFFKHSPTFLNRKENPLNAIDRAVVYENALEDCIYATEKFWKKIKERS